MGYYFDFVFDDSQPSDSEAVIAKFIAAGATRVADEDIGPATAGRVIDLLWPKFGYPITVFRKEPENFKGNWAHIRISWAESSETLKDLLGDIFELADAVGCRVYDGQVKQYANRGIFENVKRTHEKAAGVVIGLIGRCR